MLRVDNEALAANLAKYRTIDYGDGFLTVRAIKHSIDGALGPRGAWLLEPYADKPETPGRNTTPVDEIRETARLALRARLPALRPRDRRPRQPRDARHLRGGVQGDRDGKSLRWRVEHAQHLIPPTSRASASSA